MRAVDPQVLERVQRSTVVLRSMLPTLEAYASAMLGRQVSVQVGPETGTDGHRVTIRPPLALADLGPHTVSRCGARDELGILTCPTCAAMESVLVGLRHELAHHAWETFGQHRFAEGYHTLDDAVNRLPEAQAGLARALESVRVDRAACDADPQGAGAHYAMHVQKVARDEDPAAPPPMEGQSLATRFTWALLTAGVGSDTAEFVGDDAMAVLDDPVVDGLIGDDYPIEQIPDLAGKLYTRLVELGVFEDPEQEDLGGSGPPVAPGEDSDDTGDDGADSDTKEGKGDDESDARDDDAGDDEGGPGDGDSEDAQDSGAGQSGDEGDSDGHDSDSSASGSDPQGDPADADPAAGSEAGGSPGDGADNPAPAQGPAGRAEDVAQALSDLYGDAAQAGLRDTGGPSPRQAEDKIQDAVSAMLEHVDVLGEVSSTVDHINIYPPGQGPLMYSDSVSAHSRSNDLALGGLVGRARRVFSDNRAVKRTTGQPRGRVEPTLLGKRAWNPEDNRVFGSRVRPTAPSYSVLIGMDDSYSTVGRGIAELIRNCADAMGQLCARTGVEFSIYAHTTSEGGWNQAYDMEIYQLKTWSEQWTPKARARLGRLEPGNTNQDGSILRLYRRQLQSRPTTRKILLYFTDGEIPGTGGEAEAAIMRSEVQACRRAGITLLGVGIKTRSPEKFGIPTVSLDGSADISHVLEFLAKEFGV